MKFLTERERMVLALIVLVFAVGAGVQHWRGVQGMPTVEPSGELRHP